MDTDGRHNSNGNRFSKMVIGIGIDILTFNTFIHTCTTQACSVLTHYSVKRLVVATVMSLPVSVSVLGIGIGEGLKYRYRWYR